MRLLREFPAVRANVNRVSYPQAQKAGLESITWGKLTTTFGATFEKAPKSFHRPQERGGVGEKGGGTSHTE